jgi:hypothetical protein
MKTVSKGGADVTASTSKKTIALQRANANLAEFVIKPASADDEVTLEDLVIDVYHGSTHLT